MYFSELIVLGLAPRLFTPRLDRYMWNEKSGGEILSSTVLTSKNHQWLYAWSELGKVIFFQLPVVWNNFRESLLSKEIVCRERNPQSMQKDFEPTTIWREIRQNSTDFKRPNRHIGENRDGNGAYSDQDTSRTRTWNPNSKPETALNTSSGDNPNLKPNPMDTRNPQNPKPTTTWKYKKIIRKF